MGRYRSRSRSYSPVRRGKHYDDPRDRGRDRASPGRSGLLVRNLPLNARNEDLRIPFERYGPLKDVYLPKNFYSGEPRGFGFVKFRYAEDAATAKERLDHTVIGGREIRIVYAEENRKTPQEMRRITGTSSRSTRRRRSPSRSPRRRDHSHSRSPSPARRAPRDRGERDAHVSSRRYRSVSRSASPKDGKRYRSAERSPRPSRSISRSPKDDKRHRSAERSPRPSRSISRSPKDDKRHRSAERYPRQSRSISRSPEDDKRHRSAERSPRRSRSISKSPPRNKKGDETRHRYSSPRGNGHDPRHEDDMPDQSPSPLRNSYRRSRSRSISKSPR